MKGVLEDLRDKPEVQIDDYLKSDYNSSPRFHQEPRKAAELVKVRFIDGDIKRPVTRSFVGSAKDYKQYMDTIKKAEVTKPPWF